MNIAGQVPIQVQIADPPPLQGTLDWQGGAQGQAGPRHNWVIPALIGAALVVVAIIFWPREQHVAPTTPMTTTAPATPVPAPSNGYTDAEREADAAQARALAKIEELKKM